MAYALGMAHGYFLRDVRSTVHSSLLILPRYPCPIPSYRIMRRSTAGR